MSQKTMCYSQPNVVRDLVDVSEGVRVVRSAWRAWEANLGKSKVSLGFTHLCTLLHFWVGKLHFSRKWSLEV